MSAPRISPDYPLELAWAKEVYFGQPAGSAASRSAFTLVLALVDERSRSPQAAGLSRGGLLWA